jgi:putative chitinase
MTQQVEIWRTQAFKRLIELVNQMQGEANAADALLDQLVRSLSKLPPRPTAKPAYAGIFGVSQASAGRKKTVEQLRLLAPTLKGELSSNDGLVDDAIRAISGLPKRPADKQPYTSLFPTAEFRLLTPADLCAIAPNAPKQQVEKLVPHLNLTLIEFDITTPLRQAHFLAQTGHESDQFRAMEEYASGVDYEWRSDLGNVYAGDGVKFKGRGLIQITGRTNYRECGQFLGVDLIRHPDRLADADLASCSAGWFWQTRKLNAEADRDDIEAATQIINGGLNGYSHRVELLRKAKKVLGV